MKIFFITPKLNFVSSGGSPDEYDLTYRTLQEMGHEVFVYTTNPEANDMPYELPYPVFEEDVRSHGQLGIQKGVFKILRKYSDKADCFFIDGQVFLYGAGLYRSFGGKTPVVAYFNRELPAWSENVSLFLPKKKSGFFKKFKKRARFYIERYVFMPFVNSIDVICFANPLLEKPYNEFGLKTSGKSFVFGDPFNYRGLMKEYGIEEDTYRKRNKKSGPFTIFYSSRMAPSKGFDMLLVAFSKLKNKDNFRLVLGGMGPEEQAIKKLVRDLNLESYVEMPGWMTKEELYGRLKKADIYVQAQWRKEVTAMSLMTAMMFGLPSIVPGDTALEWVSQKSSLCFKDGDPDDLARKIEQLSNDYELRAELSRQCYIRMDAPELNHKNRIQLLSDKMLEAVKKQTN